MDEEIYRRTIYEQASYETIQKILRYDPAWVGVDIQPFLNHVKDRDGFNLRSMISDYKNEDVLIRGGIVVACEHMAARIQRLQSRNTNRFNAKGTNAGLDLDDIDRNIMIREKTMPDFDRMLDILKIAQNHTDSESKYDFEESICCPILFNNKGKFYDTIKEKIGVCSTTDNYKKILNHSIKKPLMFSDGLYLAYIAPGFIDVATARLMLNNIDKLYGKMCIQCIYFTLCLLVYETTPIYKIETSLVELGLDFAAYYSLNAYNMAPYTQYILTKDIRYLYLLSLTLGDNAAWYKQFINDFTKHSIKLEPVSFDEISKPVPAICDSFTITKSLNIDTKREKTIEKEFLTLGQSLPKLYNECIMGIISYRQIREINIEEINKRVTSKSDDQNLTNICHIAGIKYNLKAELCSTKV